MNKKDININRVVNLLRLLKGQGLDEYCMGIVNQVLNELQSHEIKLEEVSPLPSSPGAAEVDAGLREGAEEILKRLVSPNIDAWLDYSGILQAMEEYRSAATPAPLDSQGKEWIRVEDGLPEDSKDVLIWQEGSSEQPMAATYYAFGNVFSRYSNSIDGDRTMSYHYPDVTHWRYLPAPPTK